MNLTERRTERLLLRRVRLSDLDEFVALQAALEPRPSDRAEAAGYLANFVRVWDEGDLGYWSVRYQDRVVGFGGVQPKVWRGRDCWNLY